MAAQSFYCCTIQKTLLVQFTHNTPSLSYPLRVPSHPNNISQYFSIFKDYLLNIYFLIEIYFVNASYAPPTPPASAEQKFLPSQHTLAALHKSREAGKDAKRITSTNMHVHVNAPRTRRRRRSCCRTPQRRKKGQTLYSGVISSSSTYRITIKSGRDTNTAPHPSSSCLYNTRPYTFELWACVHK